MISKIQNRTRYNIKFRNLMDEKSRNVHQSPPRSCKADDSLLMSSESRRKPIQDLQQRSLMNKQRIKDGYLQEKGKALKYSLNDNYKELKDSHDKYMLQLKHTQYQTKQKQDNMLDTYHSCKKSNISQTSSQQQSLLLDSQSSLKQSNHQFVQNYQMSGNKIYDEHQTVPYQYPQRRLYRTNGHKEQDETKVSFQLSPSDNSQIDRQSLQYSYSISIDQSIQLIKSFPSNYDQNHSVPVYQIGQHNDEQPQRITNGLQFPKLVYSRKIYPIKQLIQQQDEDQQNHISSDPAQQKNKKRNYGGLQLDHAVFNRHLHAYSEKDKIKLRYQNENQMINIVRNVKVDYHRWESQDQFDRDHSIFNTALIAEDISFKMTSQPSSVPIRKIMPRLSQSIQPIQIQTTQQNTVNVGLVDKQQPSITVQTVGNSKTDSISQPANPLNRIRTSFVRSKNRTNDSNRKQKQKRNQDNINYVSMMDSNIINAEKQSDYLQLIKQVKGQDQKGRYLSTIYNIRTENSQDDGQPDLNNTINSKATINNSSIVETTLKQASLILPIVTIQSNTRQVIQNQKCMQKQDNKNMSSDITFNNCPSTNNSTETHSINSRSNPPVYIHSMQTQKQFVAPILTFSHYSLQQSYLAKHNQNNTPINNHAHQTTWNRPVQPSHIIRTNTVALNTNQGCENPPIKQKTLGKKIKQKLRIHPKQTSTTPNPTPKPQQSTLNQPTRFHSISDWCCESEPDDVCRPRNHSNNSDEGRNVRNRSGRYLSLTKNQSRIGR